MLRPADVLYGWPVKEIARVCEVDLTTARRWKRGARCPPNSALMLLSGDLGFLDPAWAGWRVVRGALYSPEGWRATPGDVLAIQLTQAQLSAYRHETLQLRATLAELEFEEQPLPENWSIAIEG
jgi:hypothetical protein